MGVRSRLAARRVGAMNAVNRVVLLSHVDMEPHFLSLKNMDGILYSVLQLPFATVSRPRLLAAAVALLAAGVALHADPAADFRSAVYQYDRARTPSDFQTVVALLRRAIAQSDHDSRQLTIRTDQSSVFLAYRPHAYLAAALARLGQCDEAREHLKLSLKDAGERNVDGNVLKLARVTCPEPPPQSIIATSTQAPRPPAVTATQPVVVPVDPFASLKDDLKAKLAEAQRVAGRRLPGNPPLTPRARRAQTALASAISAAGLPQTDAAAFRTVISALSKARDEYSDALDNLPPPALANALAAYAKGEYESTLQLLGGLNARPPFDAQVVLLRAAAGYMRAVSFGDKKPESKV